MLYVDDREGSAQLAPLLRAKGLPVTITRLPYGDVSLLGCGPGGEPVTVGVEVKTISDVLKCVTDGRFAGHQLPGLIGSYENVWLLIEGIWRPKAGSGVLEIQRGQGWIDATVGSRRFMYKDLVSWLFTMQIKGRVNVHRVSNWGEATLWLSTLHSWWTGGGGKVLGWDGHESHLALHTNLDSRLWDRAMLVRPTVCRMVATQLPGVGFDKSASIAGFFGSVENLLLATEWELAQVPGVGKKLAGIIWHSLRNQD